MQIIQYPHYLFAYSSEDSYQDERGNWHQVENEPIYIGRCREETSGAGGRIQTAGGEYQTFSALIQRPRGGKDLLEGVTIFVSNDPEGADIRIRGIILKHSSDQLHRRIWI